MPYIISWCCGDTTVYIDKDMDKQELSRLIREENISHFYSSAPIFSLLKKYGIQIDSSNTHISNMWFNMVLKK
jgi:acyl-coenzyme A synthetase/AMP-(fatty) acid ligase